MKSLRAKINEELEKEGIFNICSYGLRWEKGERLQINDVCFARAKYETYYDKDDKKGEIKELALSLKHAGVLSKDRNAIRKWVGFILNRSIFKDVFFTKNVQAAWRYGVQVDVNKPTSQCITGMIALREGWEFPHLLRTFAFLTKNGIDENVSYILSRMIVLEKGKWVKGSWGGHQTICAMNIDNMRTLLKHGMLVHDAPLKHNEQRYAVYKTTHSLYGVKNDLIDVLMKNPTGSINQWGIKTPYLNNKDFILAAKRIEKELLA